MKHRQTNDWRIGCTVPVGWVFECVLLVLLVSAVRDLSSKLARIADVMERWDRRPAAQCTDTMQEGVVQE